MAFRLCQAGARSQDALVDFLPATVLSTKPVILRHGLASETELDALIADCRQHLAKPTAGVRHRGAGLGAQAEHHDFFEV